MAGVETDIIVCGYFNRPFYHGPAKIFVSKNDYLDLMEYKNNDVLKRVVLVQTGHLSNKKIKQLSLRSYDLKYVSLTGIFDSKFVGRFMYGGTIYVTDIEVINE